MGALSEPLLSADEKPVTAAPQQQPPLKTSVVAWGLGSEVLLITSPDSSQAEVEGAASVPSALSAVMVAFCQFLCCMLLVVRLALPGCHGGPASYPPEALRIIFFLDLGCMTLASALLVISLLTTVSSSRRQAATTATTTTTNDDDVEGAPAKRPLLEHRSDDDGSEAAADGSTSWGLLCLLPSQVVLMLCVLDCLLAVGVAADLFLTLSAITRAQPSIGFGSLALVSGHYP